MGASHTPGPWTIKRSPGGRKAYISGDHWVRFARVWVAVGGDPSEEGAANAHLIAAAPDLLEALKDARAQLEHYEKELTGESYNSLAINAAIAKAEGRT